MKWLRGRGPASITVDLCWPGQQAMLALLMDASTTTVLEENTPVRPENL